jgi:dUTP pyrophosphatase
LYSAEDTVIPARGRALVKTDIKISVPNGTYGRVAPRSGLAYKHGIDTMAGVIDADYRGPVGVILANLSETDFPVKIGDRIAQLIVERVVMPDVVVVDQLEDTVRGAGGFGSTGGFGAAAAVATDGTKA